MLTSAMIKEAALAAGADLCGIGSMDRFGPEVPDEMNPRFLFPEAKYHCAKGDYSISH